VTGRLKVRRAVARCGTQTGGFTHHSAVAVDSEMRDRSCAGYVAATSLVGGRFLAGSTADRPFLMLASCLVLLEVAADESLLMCLPLMLALNLIKAGNVAIFIQTSRGRPALPLVSWQIC